MKAYKILYKLTSRSRPDKFFQTIDNIYIHQSFKSKFHIHCTLDSDDTTMHNNEVIDKLKKYTELSYKFDRSKNKIEAINRDFDTIDFDWDIVVNMSDDMVFTEKDFDKEIRRAFMEHFPDTDGCLHLPDGNQNENLITLAILGKKYYNRFKYIYHPAYVSLWCDSEMTDVAKQLNKYVYIPKFMYKHMHPAWGLGKMDAQYQRTESFFNVDKATYEQRKINSFA